MRKRTKWVELTQQKFKPIPVGRTNSFLASTESYEAHQNFMHQLDLAALYPDDLDRCISDLRRFQ